MRRRLRREEPEDSAAADEPLESTELSSRMMWKALGRRNELDDAWFGPLAQVDESWGQVDGLEEEEKVE